MQRSNSEPEFAAELARDREASAVFSATEDIADSQREGIGQRTNDAFENEASSIVPPGATEAKSKVFFFFFFGEIF